MGFVPPDGRFSLFTYRVCRIANLPVYVNPSISLSPPTAPGQAASASSALAIGSAMGSDAQREQRSSAASDGPGSEGGVCHLRVSLGARPTDGKPVDELSVRIPLPDSVSTSSLTATVGGVVYDEAAKEVTWRVGRMPKDKTPTLSGTVLLGSGRTTKDLSLSLFVSFKLVMFSCSGLKVASLRVENEEYQPYKGVRSILQTGTFEVRC
jgi:AP-3 complex subunit mu